MIYLSSIMMKRIYVALWIYYVLLENFENLPFFLKMHKMSSKLDLLWEEHRELRWVTCMLGWYEVRTGLGMVTNIIGMLRLGKLLRLLM